MADRSYPDATCREIIEFYFGAASRHDCEAEALQAQAKLWFFRSDETDKQIRERFGDDAERAARGELDAWKETPLGRLALIVLLDQFPRNLNRDSSKAFAQDPKARALTLEGLENGHCDVFTPGERLVFYLPLMHTEDIAMQNRSMDLYTKLANEPGPLQGVLKLSLDAADRHRFIVDRFGRFPHRNKALGRETTAEEDEFLKSPNSSF
jgi:uncharacterized protein (DUF924 family)